MCHLVLFSWAMVKFVIEYKGQSMECRGTENSCVYVIRWICVSLPSWLMEPVGFKQEYRPKACNSVEEYLSSMCKAQGLIIRNCKTKHRAKPKPTPQNKKQNENLNNITPKRILLLDHTDSTFHCQRHNFLPSSLYCCLHLSHSIKWAVRDHD